MKRKTLLTVLMTLVLCACTAKSYVIGETVAIEDLNSFVCIQESFTEAENHSFRVYRTDDGIQMMAIYSEDGQTSSAHPVLLTETDWQKLTDFFKGRTQRAVKRGITLIGTLADSSTRSVEFGWDDLKYEADWEIELTDEEYQQLYDLLVGFVR